MLYRSADDIAGLISRGIRVRLCKGAYKEPASVAFQKKEQVNENFVTLMKTLLDSGPFHSMATHDNAMIEATKKHAAEKGIGKDKFEFQMLYGINRSAGGLQHAGICAVRHPLVPLLLPPSPRAEREYSIYIEASI
jgi:proline dehydrogenase